MIRIIILLALCLLLACPAMAQPAQAILYTPPVNLKASAACRVFVEGQELKVIDATVNHQRTWAANPILLGKVPFGIFELQGTLSIEVQLPQAPSQAVVRPLARGIHPVITGNSIRFTVDQPGPLTVEWDGDYKNALHLFVYGPQEQVPDKNDPNVLYFGPGLHDVGLIEPKDSQTVYLAPGSVVLGAIQAQGKRDITITGRGILSGSRYDRWKDTMVPINFSDCENIHIEGITLIEPAAWCINLYKSKNITVKDVNIIGWCSNSDGITIQSCENVSVQGCFVRTWDDSLVVKGYDGDVRDISFADCVLWTDLAQSCEIGYETRAQVMERIRFTGITVLHNFHKPVLSIHNSDQALIRDILFSDITVEDAQMGEGDGARLLIELTTTKSQWSKSNQRGQIRGVVFDGIRVLSGKESSIRIFSFSKEHNIDDIVFSNLTILGQRITSFEQLRMNINNRNGDHITISNSAAQVSATYPGFLRTYQQKRQALIVQEGITASANSQVEPYAADNAIDANLNSYWEGTGQDQDVLTLRFSAPRQADQVTLLLNPASIWSKREQRITLLGSSDGLNFTPLVEETNYTFDPASGNQASIAFDSQQVLALRLVFIGNTGAAGGQVAEVIVSSQSP